MLLVYLVMLLAIYLDVNIVTRLALEKIKICNLYEATCKLATSSEITVGCKFMTAQNFVMYLVILIL